MSVITREDVLFEDVTYLLKAIVQDVKQDYDFTRTFSKFIGSCSQLEEVFIW